MQQKEYEMEKKYEEVFRDILEPTDIVKEEILIFRLPLQLYKNLFQGRRTPVHTDEYLKNPIGLKKFLFTEGKIIEIGALKDKSLDIFFAKVSWNQEGTGFTLKKFYPDHRV